MKYVSWESLFLFYTVFCWSLLRCLSSFPAFVRVSSLPSSLPSIPPSVLRGGRDLNFEQKTRGGKLCRKHLKCVPPSAVLRNVIHTQGTVSKEAESSWLKPDNAHGSLQLLQILVLLLWLFVLLLPLGPSRVFCLSVLSAEVLSENEGRAAILAPGQLATHKSLFLAWKWSETHS